MGRVLSIIDDEGLIDFGFVRETIENESDQGKRILELEDRLKWAYCKEIGADSINGLDCCDDYKDWCKAIKTIQDA